jgi:protein-tyrosine kinase
MREGVMSAEVLFARSTVREQVPAEDRSVPQVGGWNPEVFAREQIRGLVRQVFFSHAGRPVRQVVFSALDPETDVRPICRQVGESLARETEGSIAIVGEYPQLLLDAETYEGKVMERLVQDASTPLRQSATRVGSNLWLAPRPGRNEGIATASWHSYLGDVRRQFEYSIVVAPAAGESNVATAMAQFADGIILVLSAQRTRRIAARKIKEALEEAEARLLGTVLSDRTFPIPERIYRRL